nr:PREDICTED: ribonuclease P protein subunit drpp30-like isoform X1 [Musa acuminata subsp. malaccensis]
MAFCFDLSIPFLEGDSGGGGASSENKARKDAWLKAVVRAMELGYAGVLSDADRCKIAPPSFFPPSSRPPLPSTATSSGAPPSPPPFRHYTRLTVSAHGGAFTVALNGSALLRTYDLVALRPLNQDAFDEACESSEVDIISMDFSQKLPFRLRLQSIKACYSDSVSMFILSTCYSS